MWTLITNYNLWKKFIYIDYNQVWDIVNLLLRKKFVGSKWVYKIKLNCDANF